MPTWPLLEVAGLVLERERENICVCMCVRVLDSGYVGVDLKVSIKRWELYFSLVGTCDLALSCPGLRVQ